MIKYFGTQEKGKQASEAAEMITFFNYIRKSLPKIGAVATHIRNEGKRNIAQTQKQKVEGMIKGASDIFIHGCPSFCCEMKSTSKTAKISAEQMIYLEAVDKLGGFACVAYGCKGALEALKVWQGEQKR